MTRSPRVALFVADRTTGSSRLRALQFAPMLVRDGITVRICATRPSCYLPCPALLRNRSLLLRIYQAVGLFLVIAQRLWQIGTVLPQVDAVLVQKRLLFRSRIGALEHLLLYVARRYGMRVVFDVDDAIHLGSSAGLRPQLHRTVMAIASKTDLVLAGSDALARDFRPYAPSVQVAPTCVLLANRPARQYLHELRPVRLLWTGSPQNAAHLELIGSALSELARTVPMRLEIVTRLEDLPTIFLDGVNVRLTAFSPEAEALALTRSDIGLAPLALSPWTTAKCGGRILAYFTAALPVIASPVGVQAKMVRHRQTGLQATTPSEWVDGIRLLAADHILRAELGAAGRRRVEEEFDASVLYPRWRDWLLGR